VLDAATGSWSARHPSIARDLTGIGPPWRGRHRTFPSALLYPRCHSINERQAVILKKINPVI